MVGVAVFLLSVVLLVGAFSGNVQVAVNPDVASADGGAGNSGASRHISGMFTPDYAGEPTFGAASSPALGNDGCMDLNGTTKCFYGTAFTAASTTCTFRLPGATSTLQTAAAMVTNARGTVNYGEWGWSRDVMATSTSLGGGVISATLHTVIVASSTGGVSQNTTALVLPPGGYLVFKQGSTTPTGVTGRCSAEVQTI